MTDPDECADADLLRLEYAPHHVGYELTDDDLEPTGHTELLDSPWNETDIWWCRGCDTELDGEIEAVVHAVRASSWIEEGQA